MYEFTFSQTLAGQGFNLILRDIRGYKIIRDKIKIGLEIKNSFALNEFSNFRKSDNILMSLGIDATHFFFKSNNIPDNLKIFWLKFLRLTTF